MQQQFGNTASNNLGQNGLSVYNSFMPNTHINTIQPPTTGGPSPNNPSHVYTVFKPPLFTLDMNTFGSNAPLMNLGASHHYRSNLFTTPFPTNSRDVLMNGQDIVQTSFYGNNPFGSVLSTSVGSVGMGSGQNSLNPTTTTMANNNNYNLTTSNSFKSSPYPLHPMSNPFQAQPPVVNFPNAQLPHQNSFSPQPQQPPQLQHQQPKQPTFSPFAPNKHNDPFFHHTLGHNSDLNSLFAPPSQPAPASTNFMSPQAQAQFFSPPQLFPTTTPPLSTAPMINPQLVPIAQQQQYHHYHP